MRTLLLIGSIGGLVVAALAYPIAGVLAAGAVEAYIIAAKDPTAVAVDEELFEAPKGVSKDSKTYRDAVMRIYGSQTDEPTKVVLVPSDKFIHPKQLPTLTLLPVDKQKGENPLQVKTLYFFASRVSIASGFVGAILLIGWLVTRKRAPAAG